MFPAPNRRDFLQILLGGAAGVTLPSIAFGRQRPKIAEGRHALAPITSTRLSDNVAQFSGAGGNVVVVSGPDGLVLVNGGREERSSDLLRMVAEHTGGKRVQTLFKRTIGE